MIIAGLIYVNLFIFPSRAFLSSSFNIVRIIFADVIHTLHKSIQPNLFFVIIFIIINPVSIDRTIDQESNR